MLMVDKIKNQCKVTGQSIQYALMREMLNKVSFFMNITFMILNNATFIIQWLIIYRLKNTVGGYDFSQILMLWGIAASTYGFSHFFFKKSYSLSETITNGKLDSYLVQPKNVLLATITSDVEVSAIGDMAYGFIVIFLSGITLPKFFLFLLFTICGGIIMTCIAILLASLSFWLGRSDMIAETGNNLMVSFATYPDGIFKGIVRIILLTIIPIGLTSYIPVWVMTSFNLPFTIIVILGTVFFLCLAYGIFYKGLKKYSSSNLMIART